MKKFIIEREVPGAANLTSEELHNITKTSNGVVDAMGEESTPYHWIESYVAGDKIYCIHVANDEETIREHAQRGGFPANKVTEIAAIIDPSTTG